MEINKIDIEIENLIRERLEETRNCKFKEAWIPTGWACIPIQSFSRHLAEEIHRLVIRKSFQEVEEKLKMYKEENKEEKQG